MYLFEGDAIRPVALHNAPPAFAKARTRDRLFRPAPDSPVGRLGITKEVVHIADVKALKSYIEGDRLSPNLSIWEAIGLYSQCRCSRRTS